MALFKIHKGTEKNNDGTSKLPQSYVEGYAYFATDTGRFYIDTTDQASGRKMINPDAITNITRNGTTFTATKVDGSTITFTQQDNNTTYSAGTGISLSGTTFSLDVAGTKTALGLGSNAYTSTAYIAQSFGGTQYITNTTPGGDTSLCLKTNTEDSWLRFNGNETTLGWIGFAGIGDLRVDTTSGVYNILHAGNYSSYIQALTYPNQLTTDAAIDNFNYANSFRVATWNNTSSPGVSNGIILNMGWVGTSYGAQIAIDDDPTYYIALRQKDENGWKAWKRIPMADGTGASGIWPITSYSVRDYGDGRTLYFNYSADAMTNDAVLWVAAWNGSTLQCIHKNNLTVGAATKATQDGNGNVISSTYLPLTGGTINGEVTLTGSVISKGGVYSYRTGAEAQVHASGDSGTIFLYAETPSTATLGLYYKLADGTGGYVARVTQNNLVHLYGNVIGSLNGIKLEWSGSIDWADTGWIAAWNSDGTLIKALNKNSFAPASHTHSYLPLSGGTLTGSLTMASALTLLAQDSSHEGGEIVLRPATSSYKTGHFDLYDSKIRFHDGTSEYFTVDLSTGIARANIIYGAVWNDYAEFRSQNEELEPGYITYCDDDGKLKLTTERLQKFEGVVSDTFGFAIGETDDCKTPLAVSGRALIYCDPEDHFHSGDCVCAGPGGLAYRMTREEIVEFPDRIVGIVSEIPTYKTWGTGNIEVNGRIWVKVR